MNVSIDRYGAMKKFSESNMESGFQREFHQWTSMLFSTVFIMTIC